MEDALKLMIAKSPNAARHAIDCLMAIGAKSPMVAHRYAYCLEIALSDPQADWTAEERALLAEAYETPETPESRGRGYTLRIRLTEEERQSLQEGAEQAGQTMSEYARRRIWAGGLDV